ncbi:MAG TPA: ROK family protein [Gaiellaceae bacterium]|jgi:glucokinase
MAGSRVIAVDLGGTKLLAGVVDEDGVVVKRTVRATALASQQALLAELESAIGEVLEDAVGAIGVGIPSTIDQHAGRAVASVNIPLAGVDFRDFVSGKFGLPTAIENDANAAALAEHRFGAGRGTRHMVMLTLGTGIGGGLILDGRLYRGLIGAAGELGHITLDIDGPPCQGTCPGFGHLEALASGTAADHLAQKIAAERPDGDLGRAAAAGRTVDAVLAVELAAAAPGDARDVLDRIGRYLGEGIASLVNVFNPELVVLGGGFARAGDLLFEPARRVVAERALAPARDLVRIVPALLGVEAGLIGAGLVGFEALAGEPALR